MRLIIKIIVMFLLIFSLVIIVSSSRIGASSCASSLEFQDEVRFETHYSRYDFNTGVQIPLEEPESLIRRVSPDGLYRAEIPSEPERDHLVFLTTIETGERQLIYRSQHLLDVAWSASNTILILWEYDGANPLIITRFDTGSNEVLTRIGLAPGLASARSLSPGNTYIYAPIIVNGTLQQGLFFMDTVSGDITQFRGATGFRQSWSNNGRWVASQLNDSIVIIDPQSGDYHAHFPEAIEGENLIWQGDNLWFTRSNRLNGDNIWRANLSDGSIELVIDNARMEALAPDEAHVIMIDNETGDLVVYDVATNTPYRLNLEERLAGYERMIRFSDDNRCMAILLSHRRHPDSHKLLMFDLQTHRIIQSNSLIGGYDAMGWIAESE